MSPVDKPVEFALVWQPGPAGFRDALTSTTRVVVTPSPPVDSVSWIEIRSTDACFEATIHGTVDGTPPKVEGPWFDRRWAPAEVSPECRLRLEVAARATDVPGASLVEFDVALVSNQAPDRHDLSLLFRALFRDQWGQERAWFMGADWAP